MGALADGVRGLAPHSATNGGRLWMGCGAWLPIRRQMGAACGWGAGPGSPFGDKWGPLVDGVRGLAPHSATNGGRLWTGQGARGLASRFGRFGVPHGGEA